MYDVASEYVKLCTSLYTSYGKTALGESQDMHPIHAILPFLLLKSMLTYISRSSDVLRFGIPRIKGSLHEWVTFGIQFGRFMMALTVCSLLAICIQEGIYALTHAVFQYFCEYDTTGYDLFFVLEEDPLYCRVSPLKLCFINCLIVTLMLLRDASKSNTMVRIFYMVIKTAKTTFCKFSTNYVPPTSMGVLVNKKYLLERLQNFDRKKSFQDIRGYFSTAVVRFAPECVLKLCGVKNWMNVTPERIVVETEASGDATTAGCEELNVTRRKNAKSIWTPTCYNESDSVNDSDTVNEEDNEINMRLHGFDILDALLVESKLKVASR